MTSAGAMTSRTIVTSNGAAVAAHDRQDDLGALLAADLVPGPVDGQAVERRPVDGHDRVAGLEAGLLGRRALDRADDDEAAVRARGSRSRSVAPVAFFVPISAPIPSNWPDRSWRPWLVLVRA